MSILHAARPDSHLWYTDLMTLEHVDGIAAREFIDELFARTSEYLDTRLAADLHRDFPQRLWEMCCAAILLDSGHSLMPTRKRSVAGEGPDILLADGRTWVEAIAVNQGTGPDRLEWPDYSSTTVVSVPDEPVQLRILSGLAAKRDAGKRYRERGLIGPSDSYVIALNAGMVPYANRDGSAPRIIQALFSVGHRTVTLSIPQGEVIGEGFEHRPQVTKSTGSEVGTGMFLTEEARHVSAVLFSAGTLWDFDSSLLRFYRLVHNPAAETPLARGWLAGGLEHSVEGDRVVERSPRGAA